MKFLCFSQFQCKVYSGIIGSKSNHYKMAFETGLLSIIFVADIKQLRKKLGTKEINEKN